MHRRRRLLWKRHAKAKKNFQSASSIHKVAENLGKMWELEKQISKDYMATNNMMEDKVVFNMKDNIKAFFSFARTRQKVKAKVGPFLDPATGTPNPSPDFAAEALQRQYDSVFAVPRSAWSVSDYKEHFREDGDEDTLSNFTFSVEDIEHACSELRGTAAPGPDGVPAQLLKTCRQELSKPLHILWRSSLDSGTIPEVQSIKGVAELYPKTTAQ